MKHLLIIFISILTLTIQAQDFSEWRGPNRTGVYNEINLLTEWPDNGPTMLWSAENLPKGYSSVAVANKMIYFTGIVENSDVVLAYDLYGNLLWEAVYGRAWDATFDHSRCTPTVDGNRLYVSSGMGDLACINAIDGSFIWQVKASELYKGTYGKWGISESLIVLDNKVFYTPGGDLTTTIALDKLTGELIWKSESLKDKPAYVSPILYKHNDKYQIANVTENYAFAFNPENGEILWKFDFGSFSNAKGWNIQAVSPVYHDGFIYITAGYDHKGVMLEIAKNGKFVKLAWSDENLDVHHGGVVRIGDYIYGANWKGNKNGNWLCLDWKTGKVMYDQEWFSKGSIISAEGMLYCYEEKTGNIALVKADPKEFKIISSFEVPLGSGPHWSHLVIKDGVLYVRHEDALMVYDIKNSF
ncbi:MAG: PQQ-like beta-propeller repeat protein [Bacteroidetes bacterium]|nr:PQQ-like beta-propeller repeat protein [Bacteroidota bacterium]MBT5529491.1 PQQ-like beta-propeller repeat protein [Cytophagia bacterium]MBT3424420.1 PQQ-like beta-propeller repeat protein [Bacteroidota bacterium]MBT3802257.1 PQQ-like beta-propeller repeat protein [Bacteroidota bacterium]MBT4728366.1 PQQ-like beta-propeller repeat protein [Bacteroidota bacterium]